MDLKFEIRENLIENLTVGIVITTQQGQILFANQAIRDMTGYKEEEIKTIDGWYEKAYPDPEDRKKAKKYFQYDMENNINDRTYKITTAAGDYKYFNFRYSSLKDGKMLFEIIDISDRIEKKQELENQKIIFENLFTNSLEGIILLNQDFKILDINKRFEKIFKISKEDFIDENVFEAVSIYKNHKELKKEMKEILEQENWEDQVKFEVND
ncbi:MAG: PAS domain-containing protein, partial [bacterium]